MDIVEAKKMALSLMRNYVILKNYMEKYTTPVGVPMLIYPEYPQKIEELSNYILETDNLDIYNVAYSDMDYSFLVDCSLSMYNEFERIGIDTSNDKDKNINAYYSINAMCRTFVTLTDWFRNSGKIQKYPKIEQANNRQVTDAQIPNTATELSEILKGDEAQKYFAKAIGLGLMNKDYEWLKGLQMLACFVREMSLKLKMGKGDRINWKHFELLFGIKKGKLRSNYNDIQKTGQNPTESYLIDKVFE